MKDNKKKGEGIARFKDGARFEGNFREDVPHGNGVYENSIMKFEGMFDYGKFNGDGAIIYRSGETFKGKFKNNQKLFGAMKYSNGDLYEGQF